MNITFSIDEIAMHGRKPLNRHVQESVFGPPIKILELKIKFLFL